MFKITLFSIIMLLGLLSFVATEQEAKQHDPLTKTNQDIRMSFSYDVDFLQYQRLTEGAKLNQLKAHQKFSRVPQRQKMHVEGYLQADGTPYMEIKILERTRRNWIDPSGRELEEKAEIDRIIMDGQRIRSLDKRGNELISLPAGENKHVELAMALSGKRDPVQQYRDFLNNGKKMGWDIQESDHDILVHFIEKDKDITMYFDKETGLPRYSVIKSDHETSRTVYRYECIDGKYVLVFQHTGVSNGPDHPDGALLEYVNTLKLDNISFNQ